MIYFEFIGRKKQGGTDMIWGFYWEQPINFDGLVDLPEVVVFRGHFGKKITLQRKLRSWNLLCNKGDKMHAGYKEVTLDQVKAEWPDFESVVAPQTP